MNALSITFGAILTLSFVIFLLVMRPPANKAARQRLVVIQESVRPHNAGAYGTELERVEQLDHSARLGAFLERYRFAKNLKVLLTHAHSNLGVGSVVLCSVGIALGCGLVTYICVGNFLASAGAAVIGSLLPYFLLRFKRNRRVKAFNSQLPDAIDLMARSLIAGHSMGSSIELISGQSPEPLAGEFVQVFQQQRLGLHFRDALLQMGRRVPSRDLQFLITAILVQKETGGDLTEILDRASHVIRERVRIEGEVRTRTAQGRLTGWILALLPIVMLGLINLISPGYSSVLFHDPTGQRLLYLGAALIAIGALIIRKIVDVQV
ncbi:MAG TPA: type II secretion system F family protein [Acidobacteriaceae bacterium]